MHERDIAAKLALAGAFSKLRKVERSKFEGLWPPKNAEDVMIDESLRTKDDDLGDRFDWKRVARRYQRFLAQGNWSVESWVRYGYALKQSGEPGNAAHAYAMALSLGTDGLSDAHLLAGQLHQAQGDRQKALQSYKSALKFNPENSDAAKELRAFGVLDEELASIINGGKEDRRNIGLHPADRVLAAEFGFPIRHRTWRLVLAAVVVLVLLCGGAFMLFGSPEIAQDAHRSALREAQWLTGQEDLEAKATAQKAAEEKIAVEAAARKAAEQKALVEAAARKAAEERVAVEAAARKVAEQKAVVEAAARKAAEEKVVVEAAARKAAEDTRLNAEEAARKAAALPDPATLAKRPDETKLDPRQQAERAEAALNLSEQDRKGVQVELNSLGYEMPTATGYFGPRTRAMVTAWQKKQGLSETGYLDASQLAALHEQATQAKRVDETKVDPRQQVEREEAGLNLSEQDRKRVQVALNSLGHEFPTVTGYFGPRTRAMIAAWQKAQGLPETGFLTASQLATLQQQAAPALAKYDQAQLNPKMTSSP
jgi:peptidoglycan hydrolase-like protein with peptidoglycan-binding domain